jgi:hypothetical protein
VPWRCCRRRHGPRATCQATPKRLRASSLTTIGPPRGRCATACSRCDWSHSLPAGARKGRTAPICPPTRSPRRENDRACRARSSACRWGPRSMSASVTRFPSRYACMGCRTARRKRWIASTCRPGKPRCSRSARPPWGPTSTQRAPLATRFRSDNTRMAS